MKTSQRGIDRCLTRTFQWGIERRLLAATSVQHILTTPPSAVPAGQRKAVGSHGADGGGCGSRGVPPSEQSVRQQSFGSATHPAGGPRSNHPDAGQRSHPLA
eukprot:6973679-Pyramimonas_sp.AAC.1